MAEWIQGFEQKKNPRLGTRCRAVYIFFETVKIQRAMLNTVGREYITPSLCEEGMHSVLCKVKRPFVIQVEHKCRREVAK